MEFDHIFVDESGNASLSKASLKKSHYFSLGFVYSRSPSTLSKHLKRLLKRLHDSKKYPRELNELKFFLPSNELIKKYSYTSEKFSKYVTYMPEVRKKSINIINTYATGTFSAICDKTLVDTTRFKSAEILGNWLFANTLCKHILPRIYYDIPPNISYDAGRLTAAASKEFKTYLHDKDAYLKSIGIRTDSNRFGDANPCSSYSEPGIWAADIVAGSYRLSYQESDDSYSSLFTKKIQYGKYFYWTRKSGGPRGTPNQA